MQNLADAAVWAFQCGNCATAKRLNQLFGTLRQKRKAFQCINNTSRKVRQDFYRWRAGKDI